MVPGKDQIVLHASTGFKDRLGEYAAEHGTSMADVIRTAVAERIGYDLGKDPARSRTPKYATPEEAKRAALDRAAILRWANSTSSRLLASDNIEAAMIIARAIANKDYDTLDQLKNASKETTDEDSTD